MPRIDVFFYQDEDGTVPVLDWMEQLRRKNRRAYLKCFVLIDRLREFGHELRRPAVDYLRDGIYELRTSVGGVNYRLLYAFVGSHVALLIGGLVKERKVPDQEIDRAVRRVQLYQRDPERHRYEEE